MSKVQLRLESPLPVPAQVAPAPLVALDFRMEDLKSYLDAVAAAVNSHADLLKDVLASMQTKVSYPDLLEVYEVPPSLNPVSPQDCLDQVRSVFANVWSEVKTFSTRQAEIAATVQNIKEQVDAKATQSSVTALTKHIKSKLRSEISSASERSNSQIQAVDAELRQKLSDVEQGTLWRIKDCEELLKSRVSEAYVADAAAQIEARLNHNIPELVDLGVQQHDKALHSLRKELTQLNTLASSNHSDLHEVVSTLNHDLQTRPTIEDFRELQAEFTKTKAELAASMSEQQSRFMDSQRRITAEVQAITTKSADTHMQVNTLTQEFKQTKSELADRLGKATKFNSGQRYHNPDQLSKFKETVYTELRKVDLKLEQVTTDFDVEGIKNAIKNVEEETKTLINSVDKQLKLVEKESEQHYRETHALHKRIGGLKRLLAEQPDNYGLLTSTHFASSQCLSCGKNDTPFVPIRQPGAGCDGRMYRVERPASRAAWSGEQDADRLRSASQKKITLPTALSINKSLFTPTESRKKQFRKQPKDRSLIH